MKLNCLFQDKKCFSKNFVIFLESLLLMFLASINSEHECLHLLKSQFSSRFQPIHINQFI